MSQIGEAYQTLVEIDRLLADIELKITKISDAGTRQQFTRTLDTFREVERLALRWLVLSDKLGLPEDMTQAANNIARLVTLIQSYQISINLLLATNPITAAIGVAGLIGVSISATDVLAGYV